MTQLFFVDFKNKKLISKKTIDDEAEVLDQVNLAKLAYFSELIENNMVSVKINTTFVGVDIPLQFKSVSSMVINWSYKFQTHDFSFDENGIKGTLSFNGKSHHTILPWGSIWGISLAGGAMAKDWPEYMPKGPDDDGPGVA